MTLHEKEFLAQEAKKIVGKLTTRIEFLEKKFKNLDIKDYEAQKSDIKNDVNTMFSILDKAILQ
jgi:septation ring formation regulator EzrA